MRVFACTFMLLCAIAYGQPSFLTQSGCFPEGFLVFPQLSPAMAGPRRSVFSCDSCAIYMFTLTISICCFWNNQLQGPRGEAPVNRARLGFHDFGGRRAWGLGLIMLKLRWWWGCALKVSGGKQGLLG